MHTSDASAINHEHSWGVAVVTGGSAGLGRAITRELAKRGWDVAILARGADGIAGAIADIERLGRKALGVQVDVADADAVDAAATEVEATLGPIRLWVNNAMVGTIAEFMDLEAADFDRVTAVTYLGTVNGTRAALARMQPRNAGHIIQVGSALGHRGIPLQAAYCGAKHAIHGFTDSVVAELTHADSEIAVSIVDMPALNTPQFNWVKNAFDVHPQPVAPIYEPEVGARAVADVAGIPRRRTWVGEPTVGIVLGTRFASRLLDTFLARTAYDGQMAHQKDEPMLPTNLYEPVPGDHGARGIFSDQSLKVSPQTWALRHRRGASVAAATLLGAAAAIALGATRRR